MSNETKALTEFEELDLLLKQWPHAIAPNMLLMREEQRREVVAYAKAHPSEDISQEWLNGTFRGIEIMTCSGAAWPHFALVDTEWPTFAASPTKAEIDASWDRISTNLAGMLAPLFRQ